MNNLKEPLVSILTPCYNGEKTVEKFLSSVLNQYYNNFELIFVNDGSTDATESIFKKYVPLFQDKGVNVLYLYQENKGQAAAINLGLKHINGVYFSWPDSDDILHPNYISKKVELMLNNSEFDLLVTRSNMINPITHEKIGVLECTKSFNNQLFLDLLLGRNVYYAPGGFFVKSKTMFQSLKDREIYASRGGQNFQLLLPIAYNGNIGFTDDILYDYMVYDNSHSRQAKTYDDHDQRMKEHESIIIHVLDHVIQLSNEDKERYKKLVHDKYMIKRFDISLRYNDKPLIRKLYLQLKRNRLNSKNVRVNYHIKMNTFIRVLLNSIKAIIKQK